MVYLDVYLGGVLHLVCWSLVIWRCSILLFGGIQPVSPAFQDGHECLITASQRELWIYKAVLLIRPPKLYTGMKNDRMAEGEVGMVEACCVSTDNLGWETLLP